MSNNSDNRTIQDYLSLGYLYILILGILTESIRYSFVGINIINYSTVLDVLLSPISILTQTILLPIGFIIFGFLAWLLVRWSRKKHERKRTNPDYRARKDFDRLEYNYHNIKPIHSVLFILALFIFSAYCGYGIGGGYALKEDLTDGNFQLNRQITFADDTKIKVKEVGHNSLYFFCLEKSAEEVSIIPIQGNIKKIENIN
ncbi:MAG: hypothetical protein AAGJ18_28780 [Bacteroidota bacterium]